MLSGKVDRIEGTPDGTGCASSTTRPAAASPASEELARHPQLGAYQLGVEQGRVRRAGRPVSRRGAAPGRQGRHCVKTTLQKQRPLRDDDDPQWAADLVTATAEGMAGATFPATVGDWCKLCQVRASCPAQPEGRVL